MNILGNTARMVLRLAPCLWLAGCMTSTPVYDKHFGDAVNQLKAMQILNPQAALNADPVSGIDGKAAKDAMDRYQQSFRKMPAQPSISIGVGANPAGSQ